MLIRIILLFITVNFVFVGCAGENTTDNTLAPSTSNDVTPEATDSNTTDNNTSGSNTTPLDSAEIIFLHHSTGGNIWNGGVSDWITTYNEDNGTTYNIIDRNYPKSSPYGWNNYPYDYWNIWVNHEGDIQYMEEDTLEILSNDYNVIVWKHCYPASNVLADTGSPDISSSRKSTENYKLQYQSLKQKMLSFPNTRFIVWTGAALVESRTDEENATRARDFFQWVKNTWDEANDNIYVWDFFELETEGGLYLLEKNAASATDSHPNGTFASRVAPLFSQRIINVIEGRGDTTSMTGE